LREPRFEMAYERPPAAFGGSPPHEGENKHNLPIVRGRRERSERGGRSHSISNRSCRRSAVQTYKKLSNAALNASEFSRLLRWPEFGIVTNRAPEMASATARASSIRMITSFSPVITIVGHSTLWSMEEKSIRSRIAITA